MTAPEWFKYMKTLALTSSSWPSTLGLGLRHALLRAPTAWGSAARKMHTKALAALLGPKEVERLVKSHGDLLPLPLDWSAEDDAWDDRAKDFAELSRCGDPAVGSAAKKAWLQSIVMILNTLHETPQSLERKESETCFSLVDAPGASAVEMEALRLLERKIEHFLESMKAEPPKDADWQRLLRSKKVGYGGEVVGKAQKITLEQVLPGLPPEGLGASVSAHGLATGKVRELLADPSLVIKAVEEWPETTPRASIMADPEEAIKIAVELVRRKIFRVARKGERVWGCDGRLLSAGLFGVGKGKQVQVGKNLFEILRLTSNELQGDFDGDTATLPYLGNWESVLLEKGVYFYWSGEDLKSAFYLFELPECWGKYFLIDLQIPGHLLGVAEEYVMVTCNVIPMGWKLAVGVVQHLIRQLARRSGSLPPGLELRRDRPIPTDSRFYVQSFWQAYIDDVARGRTSVAKTELAQDGWLLALRETGEALGFVFDDSEKRQQDVLDGTSLGSAVDGKFLTVRPKSQRLWEMLGVSFTLLSDADPTLKDCEVAGGLWTHVGQYKKAVLSVVDRLWEVILGEIPRCDRSLALAEDFLPLCVLLPLVEIDLSKDCSEIVSASDASETGGGVTVSTGLSHRGRGKLGEYEQMNQSVQADHLLLVEHCCGIGAGRRALELLGLRPGGHVCTEVDEAAIRVVKGTWPGACVQGDLRSFGLDELASGAGRMNEVHHVVEVARTPCQDLSQANASCAGLAGERSSLFFELEQKRELYDKLWPKAEVARILENVASMSPTDHAIIDSHRGNEGLKVCPHPLYPVRRPRLFWLDWPVQEDEESQLRQRNGFRSLHFVGPRLSVRTFLDKQESVTANFVSFPSFMRAMRRRSPPLAPRGLEDCDEKALELWTADHFRFPPYQYQQGSLITCRRTRKAYPPRSHHREELMGFRRDHTYNCMASSGRRTDPQAHEDLRCSLVGNSIHTVVLAHLLAPKLHQWGYLTRLPRASELAKVALQKEEPRKDEASMMVRALCRLQSHRGGEIRLENGPESLAERPKLQALDPGWWNWRTVISCAWQLQSEPIAALEGRGHILAMKWRCRSVKHLNKRVVHLLDSQTCVGAFVKHRSKSSTMSFLCRRASALELAGSLQMVLAYCRSHRNPADEPSRRQQSLRKAGARIAPRKEALKR